jgi:hypothetical protein
MKGFTTFVPSDTIASGQPPGVDPPWRLRPTFGCVPARECAGYAGKK